MNFKSTEMKLRLEKAVEAGGKTNVVHSSPKGRKTKFILHFVKHLNFIKLYYRNTAVHGNYIRRCINKWKYYSILVNGKFL